MKKTFLFLLLLPLFSVAQTEPKTFTLNGTLELREPVKMVYLQYRSDKEQVLDSTEVKDNKFRIEGKILEPTVATLRTSRPAPIMRGAPATLFLESGQLQMTAKDSIHLFTLTGSSGQADLNVLTNQEQQQRAKSAPSSEDFKMKSGEDKKQFEQRLTRLMESKEMERREVYGNFVKSNPSSPVALHALKQYAGWDIDPAVVEPLFTSLSHGTKEYPSAIAFKKQIEAAKKTAVGAMAMDFTQNDTLDNPVKLSSFRGKYVLLDFWASWCGPCRKENPNVVAAFNTYKDKNFTVLGVSLDRPNAKDKWLKAIHDDNLTWTHVSDLKFWDNEVAKQYGIRAIPQNLLIDPSGKIIAKNIRGEELQKKLGEMLR